MKRLKHKNTSSFSAVEIGFNAFKIKWDADYLSIVKRLRNKNTSSFSAVAIGFNASKIKWDVHSLLWYHTNTCRNTMQ